MKPKELQEKLKTIHSLEIDIDDEISKKRALEDSEVQNLHSEICGVYVSIPETKALEMLNAHLLKRGEEYKRLCAEIGVEP